MPELANSQCVMDDCRGRLYTTATKVKCLECSYERPIARKRRRWRMSEARGFERAFVVVDYLQLANSEKRGKEQNRQLEISQISAGGVYLLCQDFEETMAELKLVGVRPL